jgi:hypothetical protein
MGDVISRIQNLLVLEDISYSHLSRLTGISKGTLANCLGSNSEAACLLGSHLQLIGRAFPDFSLWLMVGDECPSARQVSPLTKRVHIMNSLSDTPEGWSLAHSISKRWGDVSIEFGSVK